MSRDPVSSAEPRASRPAYMALGLLTLVYTLNFLDRQILTILAEPVKRDLHLSDTELGALTGLTFALFYTVFGVPVALLADRWNRTRIVTAACALWSVFTASCGLATGFISLAFARIGTGVGEAGCLPPAISMLSDYFPSERRGRAIAILLLGVPLGSLLGAVVAGAIAARWGWRGAFLTVGLAGLAFTPLIPLSVREPRRGAMDRQTETGDAATFMDALRFIVGTPSLLFNMLGAGLTAFVSYGLINWAPAFLTRVQGMSLPQIAIWYGPVLAATLFGASWVGAMVADRFGSRRPMLYALIPAIGILMAIPFLFGFTRASSWQVSLALLVAPLILSTAHVVPAMALLQNRAAPQYRATVSSIMLLFFNLIGLGFGPMAVGMMSDRLTPAYGPHALAMALQWLTLAALLAFLLQLASARALYRESKQSGS